MDRLDVTSWYIFRYVKRFLLEIGQNFPHTRPCQKQASPVLCQRYWAGRGRLLSQIISDNYQNTHTLIAFFLRSERPGLSLPTLR